MTPTEYQNITNCDLANTAYSNIAIQRSQELSANKLAVQSRLENIVKGATGWSELDKWAKDALDAVSNNKFVDIAKLDSDIATWIANNGGN
jgi:hypothetical protein